ncbi:MAG TPA: hypothetical protein VF478_00325 [Anaerolineae bacterium]
MIVFNGCIDRTPEIVAEFARQNPERVRAFDYVPEVFVRGSRAHRREPPDSVHSLVHYFNFALSKASYQIRCKWDGDQIADPVSFGGVVQRLYRLERGSLAWRLSPWQWGAWWYCGVNLWDEDGQVLVPTTQPFIGTRRDHRFWPAGRWVIYKRYPESAYLFTRLLFHRYVGCVFFHLKGMKKDRGLGTFELDKNADSPYVRMVKKHWDNPALQTFERLELTEPSIQRLPDPAELNIRPIVER